MRAVQLVTIIGAVIGLAVSTVCEAQTCQHSCPNPFDPQDKDRCGYAKCSRDFLRSWYDVCSETLWADDFGRDQRRFSRETANQICKESRETARTDKDKKAKIVACKEARAAEKDARKQQREMRRKVQQIKERMARRLRNECRIKALTGCMNQEKRLSCPSPITPGTACPAIIRRFEGLDQEVRDCAKISPPEAPKLPAQEQNPAPQPEPRPTDGPGKVLAPDVASGPQATATATATPDAPPTVVAPTPTLSVKVPEATPTPVDLS